MFQNPQNKTNVWSKSILRGWRYSSAIKNTDCSTQGPNLHFQFRASDIVFQFPQALPEQNIHSNETKLKKKKNVFKKEYASIS